MRLDVSKVEATVDRHLAELRDELLVAARRADGKLTLDVASSFMRAAYGKGYTDGLQDDSPPPFAMEAERLLRSRASLTGSRARRR